MIGADELTAPSDTDREPLCRTATMPRLVTERPDAAERVADGRIAPFDLGLAGRTVARYDVRMLHP